jgi:prevent-host-death family protein
VPYYRKVIYNNTIARIDFAKLVDKALAGEEVILARRNDPVAELVPARPGKALGKKRRRKLK